MIYPSCCILSVTKSQLQILYNDERTNMAIITGAFTTNDISTEFEIQPKFAVLWLKIYSTDNNEILYTSKKCSVCKISFDWLSIFHTRAFQMLNSIKIRKWDGCQETTANSNVLPGNKCWHFKITQMESYKIIFKWIRRSVSLFHVTYASFNRYHNISINISTWD